MSSVLSCPLHKQPRRNREGNVSPGSTSESYFTAELIGARSWQKQLLSRFLCHLEPQLSAQNQNRTASHRAKGDCLFYVQWLHRRWRDGSGPKPEAAFPPGRSSPACSPPTGHAKPPYSLPPPATSVCSWRPRSNPAHRLRCSNTD